MNIQGVYEIINRINGRRYVGSSINVHSRYTDHRRNLRKGVHHNVPLQRAWNKHGESAFEMRLLESVENRESLIQTEQWYLDTGSDLYNTSTSAARPSNIGRHHSEETKAKIGAANKIALKGKKIPASVIAKRVASVVGQRRSDETRARMRAAQAGHRLPESARVRSAAVRRGVPLSDEHRAKVSASLRGKSRTAEHRANLSLSQRGKPKTPEQVHASESALHGENYLSDDKALEIIRLYDKGNFGLRTLSVMFNISYARTWEIARGPRRGARLRRLYL